MGVGCVCVCVCVWMGVCACVCMYYIPVIFFINVIKQHFVDLIRNPVTTNTVSTNLALTNQQPLQENVVSISTNKH